MNKIEIQELEERIKEEYEEYKDIFKEFQGNVFNFLEGIIVSKEYSNIDIAEIKERPGNKIKSLESILVNIRRPDKYIGYSSIFDIKDISGVKVICHCEDDLIAFAEIIENKLNEEKFIEIKKEIKGETGGLVKNKKNRPSYRAIHITFCKYCLHNRLRKKIYCEIQMRTVMGDAWAVQDRKYRYGEIIPEGDRNILTDSVSEIMAGCEGLWSLVKKKYKDGIVAGKEEVELVANDIELKIEAVTQQDSEKFNIDLKHNKL